MKKIFLLIFILFNLVSSYAQDRCGLDFMTEILLEENPNVSSELDQYDRFLNTIDQSNSINTREVLNIPVVVHVIYSNSTQNIPDSRIHSQIEILNKDYNRQNTDKNNTPSFFKDKAGIGSIQFYLATKDENGQATSGITRHEYTSISSTGFIENTIKKATHWDTKKYLNIWVLKMPDQNILGYSYLPLQSILNTHKDGLVIDYQRFGYMNSNNNGRTATHELGHYLGLQHPWGSQENCNSDDGIPDTPDTSGPYYGCPSFPQSKCSQSSMFMNFMDYVNDYIFDGEYILLGEDGTVRTIEGYPVLQYATGKFWVNNHTHIIKARAPYNNFFIWNYLSKKNIDKIITGAVQPKINQTNLKSLDFPIFPENLVKKYIKTTNPHFNKINKNKAQIRTLEKLRDTLLPKLMSGEVRITSNG